MNQDNDPDKPIQKKRFSEQLLKVFKPFKKSSEKEKQLGKKRNSLSAEEFQTQLNKEVQVETPPILDLLNFEYIYSSLKSISEDSVKKCIECIKVMTHDPIDTNRLATMIYLGVDEEIRALRGVTWRVLLGYLPPTRKQWITIIEKNALNYARLVEEHIIKLKKASRVQDIQNDHPLSREKNSNWNIYFEDQKLWMKIEKDTKRTRQKEGFFGEQNKNKITFSDNIFAVLSRNRNDEIEYNYDVLTRMLFLYAKLNNDLYVQGMNEIIALIYYCFATDASVYLRQSAEIDTFYCFCILMTEMKENFSKLEVENNEFLRDRIRLFSELLKRIDGKLQEHLQKLKIDFKLFCVKWFIASLAQEFSIMDAMRIWDSIICQFDKKSKNDFVQYLCVSLLIYMREDLMKGEFGEVIMRLQRLEDIDIAKVISNAYLLQKEYKK